VQRYTFFCNHQNFWAKIFVFQEKFVILPHKTLININYTNPNEYGKTED